MNTEVWLGGNQQKTQWVKAGMEGTTLPIPGAEVSVAASPLSRENCVPQDSPKWKHSEGLGKRQRKCGQDHSSYQDGIKFTVHGMYTLFPLHMTSEKKKHRLFCFLRTWQLNLPKSITKDAYMSL